MPTVIVHGPRGCGKTRYKRQIADALGCAAIVDDWEVRQPIVPGALHITNGLPDHRMPGQKQDPKYKHVRILPFSSFTIRKAIA